MSDTVRAALESQARACDELGSTFMAQLMSLCAARLTERTDVGNRVLGWKGNPSGSADSVPLRLAGALHALKRRGHRGLGDVYPPHRADDDTLWAAVETALAEEADFVLDRLESPPQTNEVRRAAALIPALHLLHGHFGLPIRLIEIGCSAGLNLRADLFHLTAGATTYGPSGAPVRLVPDWSGVCPAPSAPAIAERIGIDITPLEPTSDADRLLSYLWPDQPDRIARTQAAIALAQVEPATLIKSDAVDWLRSELGPRKGQLTVLFHTIAWQYLHPLARDEGDRLIAAVGARATRAAPLARFAMEAAGPHAELSLECWPGQGMLPLGRADYHGRWVAWERATLAKGPDNGTR